MSDELKFEIIGKGTLHEDAAFLIQEQYKKFFFVPEPAFRVAVANGRLLGAFRGSKLVACVHLVHEKGRYLSERSIPCVVDSRQHVRKRSRLRYDREPPNASCSELS